MIAQAHCPQYSLTTRPCFIVGEAKLEPERHLHILARCERLEQVVRLEDETYVCPYAHQVLVAGIPQFMTQNTQATFFDRTQRPG